MLRRLGPQPFPLPILFGRGERAIQLSVWELTRGQAESYDAYAALIAYNPEWATVAAQNASISTQAFSAAAYLGPYADDTAATAALSSDYTYTHRDVADSDVSGTWRGEATYNLSTTVNSAKMYRTDTEKFRNYNYVQGIWQDTTFGNTFTASLKTWLGHRDADGVVNYFKSNGYDSSRTYIYYDTTLSEVRIIESVTETTVSTAAYYDTTNDTFRKTTDGGTTWADTDITDTPLANAANAVFVPPSAANTSIEMRTYLDTGENYNENNTYYFYNGTAIREVTAFTPSVAAVVKLANYMLDADTPAELSFMDAVVSGTLPVDLVISHVIFTIEIESVGRKARIPVLIVLTSPVPSPLIGDGLITLNWDAVSDAEGYRVYYRVVGATDWIEIQRSDATALTESFTPLTNDTLYEFQVVAYGAGYQDSLPGEAFAAPAFENPYETWLSNEKVWVIGGKVWVFPIEETETFETYKLSDETWVIGNETWVIDKW